MHTMYTKYVTSFTNGTQTEAAKLVYDRSGEAFAFLVKSCKEAWINVPENVTNVRRFVKDMEQEAESKNGGGGGGGPNGDGGEIGPGGKTGR